jgi:hypothetical protein
MIDIGLVYICRWFHIIIFKNYEKKKPSVNDSLASTPIPWNLLI